jgi:hypothetical protein
MDRSPLEGKCSHSSVLFSTDLGGHSPRSCLHRQRRGVVGPARAAEGVLLSIVARSARASVTTFRRRLQHRRPPVAGRGPSVLVHSCAGLDGGRGGDPNKSGERPGDVRVGSTHGWRAATGKELLLDITTTADAVCVHFCKTYESYVEHWSSALRARAQLQQQQRATRRTASVRLSDAARPRSEHVCRARRLPCTPSAHIPACV